MDVVDRRFKACRLRADGLGIRRREMSLIRRLTISTFLFFLPFVYTRIPPKCENRDMNCYQWVSENPERCTEDEIVAKDCKKACGTCEGQIEVDPKYDIRVLPPHLHKIAFLVGKWRSEFGGKAHFPTMPKFTYGEQLDISYVPNTIVPQLNYTAFAWDNNNLGELHSEYGYIAGQKNTSLVSLTTVMSNGFVTVEAGNVKSHSLKLWLRQIGRLSFSNDLPVRRMLREWILLNETFMESRLVMATQTHPMLLHTNIVYKKIYP
ncbi:hypothetical protein M3Y94_00653400 [Aphelenchoides besseyi]|nr:hypothetical protein M3Y94_00653400 [Aphelenchoides besseyi]